VAERRYVGHEQEVEGLYLLGVRAQFVQVGERAPKAWG
jgi:hypothetical protein